jgi:hypothetical protein
MDIPDFSSFMTNLINSPMFSVLVGSISFFVGMGFQMSRDRNGFKQLMRSAAIEKRLEVHQEAYEIIADIQDSIERDNLPNIVDTAITWWKRNCLYLGPKPRSLFASLIYGTATFFRKNEPVSWDITREKVEKLIRSLEDASGLPPIHASRKMNRRG